MNLARLSGLPAATFRGLPYVLIVMVAVLLSAPFGLPGQAEMESGLILGTVWYWSLYCPTIFRVGGVFLSGLVAELFLSGPPGCLLLWMLIAYGIAHAWRHGFARYGFLAVWGGFCLVILGDTLTTWVLMSLRALSPLPFLPAFFQFCLGAGFYPLLTVFYTLLRKKEGSRRS